MIKLLSQGELETGQYVMIFEQIETIPYFNQEEERFDEYKRNTTSPALGIPLFILDKAGPIIECQTYGLNGTKVILFYDSRRVHFVEVMKEYHDNYYKALGYHIVDIIQKKPEVKDNISQAKEKRIFVIGPGTKNIQTFDYQEVGGA